ncbi:MAG TPA: hypothetical protein VHW72_11580, partial [Candidatus Angelobacter sp.]|nr:hypothetical protein [Candidatus Angelobacter sp.]
MPATVMPCSVPEMKMMRHMQMNVQRAAQERECGIGKSHDETDQIKHFPVHGFTSLNLAALRVAALGVILIDVASIGVNSIGVNSINLGLAHFR